MLKKIETDARPASDLFIRFSSIEKYSNGTGIAYCYNSVQKTTKAGKPFVTLYLRDCNGLTVPGYIFDLASPLLSGVELKSVVGKPVKVNWTENYLSNVGLTLILDKVAIVTDLSSDDLSVFVGGISAVDDKMNEISSLFKDVLKVDVALPFHIREYSSIDYAQGRIGGLCEYYWRICKLLSSYSYLPAEEYRRLIGTFVIFVYTHSNYVRVEEAKGAGIDTVSVLTSNTAKLSATLKLGDASMEIVHMFFGYKPKDIYCRVIKDVSDMVLKQDHEFSLYHTIPLSQEGDAGYGAIRRYQVEDEVDLI